MPFQDRRDAGRRLAEALAERTITAPAVIGLPRGGVPVGHEVAARLGAPLEVLMVRKLGYPAQPELGIGAIAEGGVRVLNEELVRHLGVSDEMLDEVTEREQRELERRVDLYRAGRPPIPLTGRTAILVDDGLATGFTARAAIESLRRQGAARIVLAVPVGSPDTVAGLRGEVDEIVAVETPAALGAIGMYYREFGQVADEEVARILGATPPEPS